MNRLYLYFIVVKLVSNPGLFPSRSRAGPKAGSSQMGGTGFTGEGKLSLLSLSRVTTLFLASVSIHTSWLSVYIPIT